MKDTIIVLMGLTVLLMTGCSLSTGNSKEQTDEIKDTVYTEAKAMSFHRTEPERAMTMIDSAVIVGNVSPMRGGYLKAITQYGGLHNIPLARQTCLDLIDSNKRLKELTRGDSTTLENIYLLLTSIEYTAANHTAIIRYATEASKLAHALDMPDEVGKMEGFIARSMAQTGRTDEGIERLSATIAELRKLDSFKGVVAYHDTSKKLLHILLEHNRFQEMETLCKELLERIDQLGSHPEQFSGMLDGFNPAEYVDYARGQTLAFLTVSYARQAYDAAHPSATSQQPKATSQQLLQKARETEAEVFKTEWSQGIDCDKMMSAAYHYMGEFDRFDKAMRRFENHFPDTINPNFAIGLEQRYEACKMQGRTADALSYLQRAYVIRDSLDRRNQRDQLNELATIYHLQEERLSRQEAEAEAERSRIINIALAVGLVAAIAFLVWAFRQKRIMEKKNRVLVREISETVGYKEMVSEKETVNSDTDAVLFQQLREVILREQLYLNPRLDRQMLVDRFGVSKERIGAAFSKGSTYKSLIDFLTDCRLPYAAKLLATRPDLSITDVARESGFSSADTFGRNFRHKYTLTPSQYRDRL